MGRRREEQVASREGDRYLLGRIDDSYGIWERPAGRVRRVRPPVATYPLSDDGWAAASQTFAGLEPDSRPAAPPEVPRKRSRKRLIIGSAAVVVVVAVIAAVLRVGTGNDHSARRISTTARTGPNASSAPSTLPPARGDGYLASTSDWVDFVQWTDTSGHLAGAAQAAYVDGTPPNTRTKSATFRIAGVRNGSQLTLSFDGGPDNFGTINGGSFTMNFPQQDGTLAPVTFRPASVNDFNRAVADLTDSVNESNAAETAANNQAKAEQAAGRAATKVIADIKALNADEASLSSAAGAIPAELESQAKDIATTQSLAKRTENDARAHPDGNSGEVCAEASEVEAEASSVEADASSVAADASSVSAALSALRRDVGLLQSDFAAHQAALAAASGYTPASPPSQSDVNQAASAANNAAAAAVRTTNGYIDQANQGTKTAYGYAADAMRSGNCGTPSQPGHPQQHIS
jgi:hypothetical protein